MHDGRIVLGIDLGTTYSCAAYVDDSDRPVVVPNAESEQTTPSVVFFESATTFIVGREAKKYVKLSPETVVECVKRDIGNPGFRRNIFGHDFHPEEISSIILRKIVGDVEQYLGLGAGGIKDVVITCPAYFGINEREATRTAGELAGLNVLRLLNEPTAAAFCYGLTRAPQRLNVLVYDLGGGTFDVTLISVEQGHISVLLTGGKRQLGGRDWDVQLADHLAARFLDLHGDIGSPMDDLEAAQRLALDAEEAKRALTTRERTKVMVSHGGVNEGIEVTREEFEGLTAGSLLETVDLTRKLLDRAREEMGIVRPDKLLLVGGASRMPRVKAILQEQFGLEGDIFDPDLAVAKGAAIVGDRILRGDAVDEEFGSDGADRGQKRLRGEAGKPGRPMICDVSSRSFGVAAVNDRDEEEVDHLIHNNTPIPAEVVGHYGAYSDGQTQVHLRVFEQSGEDESPKMEHNTMIVDGHLLLPAGLPKGSPIDVTFRLGADGRLRVEARELKENRTLELEATLIGVLSQKEKEESKAFLSRLTQA
jgi:molecular chaperone DnaK (HSP70)